MPSRFSFDGALMFAFRAAHVRSFPWIFSAAFAGAFTAFFLILMFLARGDLAEVMTLFEALERSGLDEDDLGAVFGALLGTLEPLIGWAMIATVGSWILWAMFEAASQRRYVRDEPFYLGFGGDELRMMGVGLCWAALQALFYALPGLIMFGAVSDMIGMIESGASEDDIARSLIGPIFGAMGLGLLFFLVYVFFATRLAPSFALTIKDRQFRFLDAWNVSRGRFWPILGAYVIIFIVSSIVISIVEQVLDIGLTAVMASGMGNADSAEELLDVLFSGGVIVALAIYFLIRFFLSGMMMHVAGGPAAFAARHDPRGGVDDALQADIFS